MRDELAVLDAGVPFFGFDDQRVERAIDVLIEQRRELRERRAILPLLPDEREIVVAILRLPCDLIGDDLVELRGETDLHLVGGAARRLRDARDLDSHFRRVTRDDEWKNHERDERYDDEGDRQNRRPRALRADTPDASAFALRNRCRSHSLRFRNRRKLLASSIK